MSTRIKRGRLAIAIAIVSVFSTNAAAIMVEGAGGSEHASEWTPEPYEDTVGLDDGSMLLSRLDGVEETGLDLNQLAGSLHSGDGLPLSGMRLTIESTVPLTGKEDGRQFIVAEGYTDEAGHFSLDADPDLVAASIIEDAPAVNFRVFGHGSGQLLNAVGRVEGFDAAGFSNLGTSVAVTEAIRKMSDLVTEVGPSQIDLYSQALAGELQGTVTSKALLWQHELLLGLLHQMSGLTGVDDQAQLQVFLDRMNTSVDAYTATVTDLPCFAMTTELFNGGARPFGGDRECITVPALLATSASFADAERSLIAEFAALNVELVSALPPAAVAPQVAAASMNLGDAGGVGDVDVDNLRRMIQDALGDAGTLDALITRIEREIQKVDAGILNAALQALVDAANDAEEEASATTQELQRLVNKWRDFVEEFAMDEIMGKPAEVVAMLGALQRVVQDALQEHPDRLSELAEDAQRMLIPLRDLALEAAEQTADDAQYTIANLNAWALATIHGVKGDAEDEISGLNPQGVISQWLAWALQRVDELEETLGSLGVPAAGTVQQDTEAWVGHRIDWYANLPSRVLTNPHYYVPVDTRNHGDTETVEKVESIAWAPSSLTGYAVAVAWSPLVIDPTAGAISPSNFALEGTDIALALTRSTAASTKDEDSPCSGPSPDPKCDPECEETSSNYCTCEERSYGEAEDGEGKCTKRVYYTGAGCKETWTVLENGTRLVNDARVQTHNYQRAYFKTVSGNTKLTSVEFKARTPYGPVGGSWDRLPNITTETISTEHVADKVLGYYAVAHLQKYEDIRRDSWCERGGEYNYWIRDYRFANWLGREADTPPKFVDDSEAIGVTVEEVKAAIDKKNLIYVMRGSWQQPGDTDEFSDGMPGAAEGSGRRFKAGVEVPWFKLKVGWGYSPDQMVWYRLFPREGASETAPEGCHIIFREVSQTEGTVRPFFSTSDPEKGKYVRGEPRERPSLCYEALQERQREESMVM